jgi:hypothetical protein
MIGYDIWLTFHWSPLNIIKSRAITARKTRDRRISTTSSFSYTLYRSKFYYDYNYDYDTVDGRWMKRVRRQPSGGVHIIWIHLFYHIISSVSHFFEKKLAQTYKNIWPQHHLYFGITMRLSIVLLLWIVIVIVILNT